MIQYNSISQSETILRDSEHQLSLHLPFRSNGRYLQFVSHIPSHLSQSVELSDQTVDLLCYQSNCHDKLIFCNMHGNTKLMVHSITLWLHSSGGHSRCEDIHSFIHSFIHLFYHMMKLIYIQYIWNLKAHRA